ncbi:hypothetical protein Hanom_Chr17g01528931 [Helianthus anomalus]
MKEEKKPTYPIGKSNNNTNIIIIIIVPNRQLRIRKPLIIQRNNLHAGAPVTTTTATLPLSTVAATHLRRSSHTHHSFSPNTSPLIQSYSQPNINCSATAGSIRRRRCSSLNSSNRRNLHETT